MLEPALAQYASNFVVYFTQIQFMNSGVLYNTSQCLSET